MLWSVCTRIFIPFFSVFVATGYSCPLARQTHAIAARNTSSGIRRFLLLFIGFSLNATQVIGRTASQIGLWRGHLQACPDEAREASLARVQNSSGQRYSRGCHNARHAQQFQILRLADRRNRSEER